LCLGEGVLTMDDIVEEVKRLIALLEKVLDEKR
jgi:hypothetical protein